MPKSLVSTLWHMLELVVILGVVWLINHYFNIGGEQTQAIVLVVLSGVAKLARASEGGLPDYVNQN